MTQMTPKIAELVDNLKFITLLEASTLVDEVEKFFKAMFPSSAANFSAGLQPPLPIDAAPAPVAEEVEEKTTFDVTLTEVPSDKKISILKVVRSVTALGLKESKEIVDNVPRIIKVGITKAESESIKKEFETAGAKVNII